MQNLLNPGITIPIGDGFTIYYYAIIIVFGIICAAVVAGILFKHRNLPADWILDLLLCVLPLGIIGARTFFCLTDPSTSIADWFTKFRDGGLSASNIRLFAEVRKPFCSFFYPQILADRWGVNPCRILQSSPHRTKARSSLARRF